MHAWRQFEHVWLGHWKTSYIIWVENSLLKKDPESFVSYQEIGSYWLHKTVSIQFRTSLDTVCILDDWVSKAKKETANSAKFSIYVGVFKGNWNFNFEIRTIVEQISVSPNFTELDEKTVHSQSESESKCEIFTTYLHIYIYTCIG